MHGGWVTMKPLLFDEHLHQSAFPRTGLADERHKLGVSCQFTSCTVSHQRSVSSVVLKYWHICCISCDTKPSCVFIFNMHPLLNFGIIWRCERLLEPIHNKRISFLVWQSIWSKFALRMRPLFVPTWVAKITIAIDTVVCLILVFFTDLTRAHWKSRGNL